MMSFSRNSAFTLSAALVAAIAVGGCSSNAKTEETTQVVAKVNDDEITVSQLNFALSRMQFKSEEEVRAASRQILDSLIDQQLLLQQAKEQKLDRDPRVVQAMEHAKNRVLAQAYLDQNAASMPAVSKEETAKFYSEHPELFKKRRVYRFQELAIGALTAEQQKTLQGKLAGTPNLNNISAWLKAEKVAFNAETIIKPAEQVPMGLLEKMRDAKDGFIVAIPQGNRIQLVQLVSAQSAPMNEEQAAPFIARFIQQKQRNDSAVSNLKRLKDSASIEYKGEFAKLADGAGKSVENAPAETAKDAAPAEKDDYVERGATGLR